MAQKADKSAAAAAADKSAAPLYSIGDLAAEFGISARAIRFYERHGYGRIPNFGPYIDRPAATCLGKEL